MHYLKKNSVEPQMKMADIMEENPYIMLMMQHFEIDFCVHDLSVADVCRQYGVSEALFVMVANLYNGVRPKTRVDFSHADVRQIIRFLKNSHNYYRSDKYPQISTYIRQLQENHPEKELQLLEKFFNEYFAEVIEHLDYEDNVAFPYFITLLNEGGANGNRARYSSKEYSEHHTDIELKLTDLKNLLLKHICVSGNLNLRRKLLFALFELEFDLYIHSLIEDTILIPLGTTMENKKHA